MSNRYRYRPKRYTVLLAYPEENRTGDETYLTHVTARNTNEAIELARAEAIRNNTPTFDDLDTEIWDFKPLFVCRKHVECLV